LHWMPGGNITVLVMACACFAHCHRVPSSTRTRSAYTQANEDITRSVIAVKIALCGDNDNDPSPEVIAQVANEVYALDLLGLLVVHIARFEFEVSYLILSTSQAIGNPAHVQARKDICTIYNTLLRRQIGTRSPTIEHITKNPEIIFSTLRG
jgi:calcium binding protein 39